MKLRDISSNESNSCLLVIDVQNDFCPGGALAVMHGDQVVQPINKLIGSFSNVVFTQDWHPASHSSFASSHKGKHPFSSVKMPYGDQTLWPDHCIQNSPGAAFHPELNTAPAQTIIRKGYRHEIDSYSAFFENDGNTPTGLEGWLATKQIKNIFLAGLATDYCVAYSALDAARLGFTVTVILSACRAIDLDGSLALQLAKMKNAGIILVENFT